MRVLGIGDNVVDKYVHLRKMYPGGNAVNFAVYAKQNGTDAAFIGVFGDDNEARHVINTLRELDVDISRCRHHSGENGCARVTLEDGDRVFLGSNEGGVTRIYPIQLSEEDKDYIRSFDVIHTGLYSHTGHLLPELQSLGIPLSFDFSDDFEDTQVEKYIPYVKYAFFSCSHMTDEQAHEYIASKRKHEGQILVATRGKDRSIAFDGQCYYYQTPETIEAVDTMGAGDSYITGFLRSILRNPDIQTAMQEGSKLAAKSCLLEGSFGFGIDY